MKWHDWYYGAAYTALIWVLSMAAVVMMGVLAGFPLVVVSHTTLILSTAFLVLLLVFIGAGAGMVVTRDLLLKARLR